MRQVFWTNKKTILATFNFADLDAMRIHESGASMLETVGAPFDGHTKIVNGLALSLMVLFSLALHATTL
ncbi:hypothetical protein M405DRAFT_824364 [Rhizopogon salebrosus TDB-379]|nr:hypothetical protein M405DRAFT_824364 [Rhizopogon salebrosus TDB-379]